MKKSFIFAVFILSISPMVLHCMDPEAGTSQAKTRRGRVFGLFGSNSIITDALLAEKYQADSSTLNLSALEMTGDTFKSDIKKISDFIKKNNIQKLNLENNKFDYVPLELFHIMVEIPSLKEASLKGNFKKERAISPAGVILPEIITGLQQMISQLLSSAEQTAQSEVQCDKKLIYIEEGMPPLVIPVSAEAQKACCSPAWKSFFLKTLFVLLGAAAGQGLYILSAYLSEWIKHEATTSCSC